MGIFPEMSRPVPMSRRMLWRMALLSLAVFAFGALVVTWQAQRDVLEEGRSAHAVARVAQTLALLPAMAPDARAHALAELDALVRSGGLRHLDVRIQDAAGNELVARHAPERRSGVQALLFGALARLSPPQRQAPVRWTMPLREGGHYTVSLAVDPSSEQREAMVGIVDALTVLAISGALLLVAAGFTLKRAFAPLRGILAAIEGYRTQRYDHRAPAADTYEMDAISGALNHLAQALSEAQQQRAALSGKLMTLQEDERAHLARELHDEFGQTLTAMRADAAWLAQHLREQPELHAVAAELRAHCDHASGDIRNLLKRLRPLAAGDGGPVPLRRMLEELVEGWMARPGVRQRFVLDYGLEDASLPASLALTLHRISQEALTNAARHSDATEVRLSLTLDAQRRLHWEVRDDGVGLPDGDAPGSTGSGLAGLRERVWAQGGELDIGASRGGERAGLRLHAVFPPGGWNAAAAAEATGELRSAPAATR